MNRLTLALPLLAALLLPAAASAGAGQDFSGEARLLYRVVACAGDEPLPPNVDRKVVDAHCRALKKKMAKYEGKYLGDASRFLASLRPPQLPPRVVYPFGGGDLLTALTTYPDATEYTTLSLEHGGDPRRIRRLDGAQLKGSLEQLRGAINGLLYADNSTTENLQKMQRGELPGQLSFFLVALAIHGYEPVGLRYFRTGPDGALHYLEAEEIAAAEDRLARTLRGRWNSPDVSVAFSNLELTFRKAGAGEAAPLKVHRHFAADLSNAGLERDPGLLKHLEAKGRVSAMTKAASYLLWREQFSAVRDYLLAHMDFMTSDSTGIPPRYAVAAGFEQQTWGNFSGSFLGASGDHNRDFRQLWKSQPARAIDFRYGYLDAARRYHLLITRKRGQ